MKNFIKILIGIVCLFSSFSANAQNKLAHDIQNYKNQREMFGLESNILSSNQTFNIDLEEYFISPEEVSFLNYDNKVLINTNDIISLEIPFNNTIIIVDLIDVTDDFLEYDVVTSDGTIRHSTIGNKFYRGIIRGDDNSLVAISFYNDNVIGIISSNEGNLNISKYENSNTYMIFNDRNVKKESSFNCLVDDRNLPNYEPDVLSGRKKNDDRSINDCVRINYETEYDMYTHFSNNIPSVENYVTGMFNVVATIYYNESITLALSQIHVWVTPDPYDINNTQNLATNLNDFLNFRTVTNAELAQLLTFRYANGKGSIGGDFCNLSGNVDPIAVDNNKQSFAGQEITYQNFPVYSRSVQVSAHEFGHNFGSLHTHACVWNGNNTPIDECEPPEFNGCNSSGWTFVCPPNGGTVMSYCSHYQNCFVSFNTGFGLQPGNVIRNSVTTSSSCLGTCCPALLYITTNVNLGNVDHQEASFRIGANNSIENTNTIAVYHAAEEVLMEDGFSVTADAEYRAYIEGCSGNFVKSGTVNPTVVDEDNNSTTETPINADQNTNVSNQLIISPNPANNIVSISLGNNALLEHFDIKLYGLNGALIYQNQFSNYNIELFQVDISRFESGIYFIELTNHLDNTIHTGRIVKMD